MSIGIFVKYCIKCFISTKYFFYDLTKKNVHTKLRYSVKNIVSLAY